MESKGTTKTPRPPRRKQRIRTFSSSAFFAFLGALGVLVVPFCVFHRTNPLRGESLFHYGAVGLRGGKTLPSVLRGPSSMSFIGFCLSGSSFAWHAQNCAVTVPAVRSR